MDSIVVSHITSLSPKYHQAWGLREEILRKPLGLSLKNEDLSRDHIDVIFIAEHKEIVIGTLMLHHIDNNQVQLRAMAVHSQWQNKGIGRLLVVEAEKFSIQNSYKTLVLHARKVAIGFYQRLGYIIASDEFTEVGIPHYLMEKSLGE